MDDLIKRTPVRGRARHVRLGLVALLPLLAAACVEDRREPAPVVYRSPPAANPAPATPTPVPQPSAVAPAAAPAPVPSGQSDQRGVVFYDGYETIRARQGDDVSSMAARVGLGGAELAAYNGLSTQYSPQEGDELVLPARADGYRGQTVVATTPAPAPATLPATGNIPPTYQPSVGPATSGTTVAAATPAPTAPSPAPAEPAGSGWSAELARAAITGDPAAQEPAASQQPAPAPAAVPPVEEAPLATPPATAPAAAEAPQPELAPVQPATGAQPASVSPTTPTGNGRFLRPAQATIARSFSRAPGPNRNDGVDFATRPGDPVSAADAGTVALISKSLGGLGTIVLIRHRDEYLTVYGRLDGVTVTKGQQVARGEQIAVVADLAAPRDPYLHFEVRRGAESVDPQEYF
ncbi:MAG: M23 family metallopeptidase [Pseudomonadota bacterium]